MTSVTDTLKSLTETGRRALTGMVELGDALKQKVAGVTGERPAVAEIAVAEKRPEQASPGERSVFSALPFDQRTELAVNVFGSGASIEAVKEKSGATFYRFDITEMMRQPREKSINLRLLKEGIEMFVAKGVINFDDSSNKSYIKIPSSKGAFLVDMMRHFDSHLVKEDMQGEKEWGLIKKTVRAFHSSLMDTIELTPKQSKAIAEMGQLWVRSKTGDGRVLPMFKCLLGSEKYYEPATVAKHRQTLRDIMLTEPQESKGPDGIAFFLVEDGAAGLVERAINANNEARRQAALAKTEAPAVKPASPAPAKEGQKGESTRVDRRPTSPGIPRAGA